MKCHICDKDLTDKEVVWNNDLNSYEPCGVCLEIAFDAAFSDGFSRPDDDDAYIIIPEEDEDKYKLAMNTMYSVWADKEDDNE